MRTTLAAPHITLTFQDGGSYLGSNPTLGPPALHRDDVVSLLHRVNDSGSVNWANGAEVDHFTAHTLSLQLLGCLKSCTHLTGVSHQSEMRPWRGGRKEGRGGRKEGRREDEGTNHQKIKMEKETPNLIPRLLDSTPSLSMFAFPMCMRKSGERASSDTGKEVPYMSSLSSTTTGLGSRMADFSRPLASSLE